VPQKFPHEAGTIGDDYGTNDRRRSMGPGR
jgi:hypothetical protein